MASYYIEKSLKFLFFVLLTLMLSFPKSFAVIKIVILAFMFSMVFLHIVLGGVRRFSLDIIFFYLVFILLAVIWLIVGLLNDGYAIALGDAFRLYVVFSLIFLVLYLWLENFDYLPLIFSSIMVSTIIIFAFCFLPYSFGGLAVFPPSRVGEGLGRLSSYLPFLLFVWEGSFFWLA
ncbi:TPA: hypothetical protein NII73_001464 [Pseudomonas aeruginosa]|nr:hypothetical protein [Pseudomonas aeruginosa]